MFLLINCWLFDIFSNSLHVICHLSSVIHGYASRVARHPPPWLGNARSPEPSQTKSFITQLQVLWVHVLYCTYTWSPGSILTRWLLIPVLGSSLTQSPPPPVQPRSRGYHSARSGPALDDSRDEYCIIKYVQNLEKNIKENNIHMVGWCRVFAFTPPVRPTAQVHKCECEYVGRLKKSCLWMQQNFDSTMRCQ